MITSTCRVLLFMVFGLIAACKIWGSGMNASMYFEPEYVRTLHAIEEGNENKARTLLDEGGLTLNTHGRDGITPLFWLLMQSNEEAVALALQLGADPNFVAEDGRHTVPTVAGGNGDRLMELLLEHGGDPNARNLDGEPALFQAIGNERWSQIEMLLEQGADINKTDLSNTTSAKYAAMINQFEIAHYLISRGADPLVRDEAGADIAWTIHKRLSGGRINEGSDAYKWAYKVKVQIMDRGVDFPPPSPQHIREKWEREGEVNSRGYE